MVSHGYYPRIGGIERQRAAVTARLRERHFEPSVVCRRDPGTLPFELIRGIPVHRIRVRGPKVLASVVFTVAATIRVLRLRPDVVQVHQFLSTARVGLLATRLRRVPLVAVAHRSGPIGDVQRYGSRRTGRRRVAALSRRAAMLVGVSEEICEEIQGLGVPSDRVRLVRNGIDSDRFRQRTLTERLALRNRLMLDADAVIVLAVGRLAPEKRVGDLVRACRRLPNPNLVLLIAGDGSERAALEAQAAGDDRIRFLGIQDDVAPLYSAADIFVLCSEAEGLSNAALEACASGTAVVLTDVGAAADIVRPEVDGLLIRPGDVDGLAAALELLARDPARRAQLGQSARERVTAEFDIEGTVSQFEKLYEELLP
ncbi:MAG: hypothetical protein QOH79_3271 [Acidimicrobiaceae bacterium]